MKNGENQKFLAFTIHHNFNSLSHHHNFKILDDTAIEPGTLSAGEEHEATTPPSRLGGVVCGVRYLPAGRVSGSIPT